MENAGECLKVEGTHVKGVEKESRDTVERIVIPEGMTAIDEYAFMWCDKLKEITIPHSVKNIAEGAFCWCTSLETVRYCGTLEQWYEIDDDSLLVTQADRVLLCDGTDIKSLTELVVPEGITKIGKGTFYGCFSLGRVVLPEGLVSLPPDTFFNGSILKAEFGGTKEQWLALGNDDFTSVECKDGTVGIGDVPPYFVMRGNRITDFKEGVPSKVVIPEGVTSINVIHLREYIEDDSEKLDAPEEKPCSITDITIPASVKYIRVYPPCFKELKTVRYGGTLAQWCSLFRRDPFMGVEEHIFLCDGTDIKALEEIAIPEGVRIVRGNAFRRCTKLKRITLPTSVTEIGHNAFCKCESLASIIIPCKVVEIDCYAFYMCAALASVTIPSSVKKIGCDAFSHCPKLKEVRYGGTKEQWRRLMKYENFEGGGVTIRCSDGDIA